MEKERGKKLKKKQKIQIPAASVASVYDSSKERNVNKETPQSDLVTAINAMKSKVEALRGDVRKKDFTNSIFSGRGPQQPPLCSRCFGNKLEYCNHCFKCGSDSHFARGCQKTVVNTRSAPRSLGKIAMDSPRVSRRGCGSLPS